MRYNRERPMRGFFTSFLASLLAIVVLLVVIAGVVYWKANEKSKIEDHSYLIVDLYGDILEYDPPGDIMSEVMGGRPETLQRILDNLEKVCVDDRIDGDNLCLRATGVVEVDTHRI